MTFEEIKTLVTAIVASLGGITGIIAIINGIVRIFSSAKTAKATKANTSALGEVKDELMGEIEKRMNCALDIDISAKLNPVLNELIGSYKATAEAANEKLFAMKNLMAEMAKMMSTSRKLTQEDRTKLFALIDECGSLVEKPEAEVKQKVTVTLSAPEESCATKPDEPHRVTV